MVEFSASELILIRHGPTDRPGYLCGRTDVGLAEVSRMPTGAALRAVTRIWVSPAKRARATAEGLWPGLSLREDARLWEQDFGAWEGVAFSEVPDVGDLSGEALADMTPPEGESFRDVVTRVRPAFAEAAVVGGPLAIVAHAGVIRAALSIALNHVPTGLAFEIDHLSVTRLRCLPGGGFSIISVNGALA